MKNANHAPQDPNCLVRRTFHQPVIVLVPLRAAHSLITFFRLSRAPLSSDFGPAGLCDRYEENIEYRKLVLNESEVSKFKTLLLGS
jgi:hypothetical protein